VRPGAYRGPRPFGWNRREHDRHVLLPVGRERPPEPPGVPEILPRRVRVPHQVADLRRSRRCPGGDLTMSEQKVQMVHLTIDGRAVAVAGGTTVYQAAQQMGIEIPVFCYHDRMPPLGACRMCFVEIEKMPKLVT